MYKLLAKSSGESTRYSSIPLALVLDDIFDADEEQQNLGEELATSLRAGVASLDLASDAKDKDTVNYLSPLLREDFYFTYFTPFS